MLDWEEGDRFSFEDSDRFEEDSLCSWSSEPESLVNHWRGWKKPSPCIGFNSKKSADDKIGIAPLCELAAKCVASHIPFEMVENFYPPVPEQLQLRIAFWSFPDNEEDIRLYSCLANGSADEFSRGEHLYKSKSVKDTLQIGFHLSASVVQTSNNIPVTRTIYNVAITFDRRRISSCNCTCSSTAYWCSHVVAVCLYRIHQSNNITLRAPVSESLSRLHREQLQKFAQYLISELPQQILPTAQRLLDELLDSRPSAINNVCGAPDPTAGASINDQTSWYLDEKTLHDNIKKILVKFCVPSPIVFSDVNYLSTTAPPAAAEWSSLLRPLRGREPEGMWNLLSIVREMFKRNDRNAVPLLEIITEESMACEQILVWWFNTKVALLNGSSGHGGGGGGKHSNVNSNSHTSQHAGSSLCDEIVVLWRLAALNPGLAPTERDILHNQFTTWHLKIIEKVTKSRTSASVNNHSSKTAGVLRTDVEVFTGFKPAIEACYMDWDDYPMPGITYTRDNNPMYHCPFTCFRHTGDNKSEPVTQVNSSQAVLNHHTHHHHHYHHHHAVYVHPHQQRPRLGLVDFMRFNMATGFPPPDGARSSVSSEGFCENEDEPNIASGNHSVGDSDSQEGGGSDAASSSGASSAQSVQLPNRNIPGTNRSLPYQLLPSTSHSVVPAPKRSPETESDNSPVEETKENSRRPSKDESLSSSNSDSQQSGDEYNVYYYDPKALASMHNGGMSRENKSNEEAPNESNVFANLKRTDDPWDVLFSRAEGLHAHGHGKEACMLGVRLTEELLANPPDLMIEIPPVPRKKGKKQQVNPQSHQLSCLASATLSKCAFLCTVLAENSEFSHLAFRVGLFGLEMPRPPASTKPLEVKLANQEADLVGLLKRLPLGPLELAVIREKAEQLRDGTLKSRGEAMLPIMLASFIFDSLAIPTLVGRELRSKVFDRLPSDESLAFEAAVAALGLKANVSEADHPLLCEGTRRQRGELALTLLCSYKDDPYKIARIMERLLDREVHQLIKTPILSSYYSSNPPTKSQLAGRRRDECDHSASPMVGAFKSQDPLAADMSICSRPHSSTSAELEQNIAGLSINNAGLPTTTPLPVVQAGPSRSKEARYKGKRAYPSIPNQPSEAGAHFMFELAKNVLNKAGGSSSTSLFTQASTSQNHHGPHRALHMCAFQLGLYALGLHNCVSTNWLSRTYSSHVSWITGQAMEIGAPAISFLIDTWEGHLTPPEAVSIADRASRGCDPNIVRAAADLALSVLPHSHALNVNEIQRAILQCKEQSEIMLERSCVTVENAAKGGGVYPEVLFTVARHWYDLYVRHTPGAEQLNENETPSHDPLQLDHNNPIVGIIESNSAMEIVPQMPPSGIQNQNPQVMTNNPGIVVTTAPPPLYQRPPVTTLAPLNLTPVPYAVGPYSYAVPGLHPHHVGFGAPVHIPPPTHVQMYLSTPQFQYPPHTTNQQAYVSSPPGFTPGPTSQQPQGYTGGPANPQPPPVGYAGSPQFFQGSVVRPIFPVAAAARPPQQNVPRQPQHFTQTQLHYLLSAYRVGMLALETLARRVHDDRPQAKYARNPPYGDDVKWLLRISKQLGSQHLHQLCVCAVNSIVSPFVLHDVAIEAAQYLSRNNPALVMQHLRTALAPLVQKCQQMYIQCMHQKLYHLTTSDYEDFVSIVLAARAAFQITPEGNAQFKEWLQSIRRSKSCKKDLWAQINAALQANGK